MRGKEIHYICVYIKGFQNTITSITTVAQSQHLQIPKAVIRHPVSDHCMITTITGREVPVDGAEGFFARSAFNEYGDDAYPRDEVLYTFDETSIQMPEVNDTCTERLNELNAWLEERGARMVVAGYPIGDGEYTPEREAYDAFEAELREALDCPVISHFTDYMYPYDLFYDSNLHLTTEGAKLRTEQLIKDLEPVIEQP